MKTKFIKISTSERLPKENKIVLAIWENTKEEIYDNNHCLVKNENWFDIDFESQHLVDPNYWLEELPDREGEMIEMLKHVAKSMAKDKGSNFSLYYELKMFLQSIKTARF